MDERPGAEPLGTPASHEPAWSAPPDPPSAAPSPPISGWVTPQPRPLSPFRSARTRARLAVAALLAIIVADLLQIVHETGFDGMLEGYQRGSIGMPELEAWDGMTAMLAWLALGLVVVSGITFLGWLSRVVDNLPAIGGGVPAHGPRGAILWWFAPFASLVVPFQIVTDTHRRLATEDDHGRARLLLIGWWVAFLGGNYLNVILIAVGSGETLEDFRRMVTTWAITDSLDILGAVLAILVLLRIQRREDSRAGSLGPAAGLELQAEPDPVG